MQNNKKGFTLVELLIAMAIIALLIGLTVFGITAALRSARDTQRRNFAKDLQTAVADFQGQYRELPTDICLNSGGTQAVAQDAGCGSPSSNTVAVDVPSAFDDTVTDEETGALVDTVNYDTDDLGYCYSRSTEGYNLGVYLEQGSWEYLSGNSCT